MSSKKDLAAKRAVKAEIAKLVKELGKGWKSLIFHNGREWVGRAHFKNVLHVFDYGDHFSCFIGEGGAMLAMFAPADKDMRGRTPQEAVKKALAAYRKSFEQFTEEHRIMLNNADHAVQQWEGPGW